ncbi:MAG: N-acetylneuraminate synthase [Opitutaceae bacterium]
MPNRVLIIAEAGQNHNGDYDQAIRLVDVAKAAGADIVKFQTGVPGLVMSRFAQKADYQKASTARDESQLDMNRKINLPLEAFRPLKEYCEKAGIRFLSTPFDLVSVDMLAGLGMDTFKIPSGEITNLPYLRKIGALGRKVILSSGMCRLGEIEDALDILVQAGTRRKDIIAMHCNTEYPTPYGDVNLRAMLTIRDALKIPVGYSDHSLGIEVPIAAVAMGAVAIEKHFTLDKNQPGPDHKASLEPDELAAMVRSIRNIELALGDGVKRVTDSERKNMAIARRSVHAARDLHTGEVLTDADIIMKRPGDGISPMEMDRVVGRKLRRDVGEDCKLTWNDLG